MRHPFFFLFLALFCVVVEGFFSAFEMACVSFNRIRLQYYENIKSKRATWIKYLLNKPSRLFGTTLIAVNTVIQIGSEAARRFYESININPDFAPITQIIIVLVFGELAPLFAARRYPEHIAYLYVPIVYFISKIFTPLVYLFDKISCLANKLFKSSSESLFLLTRDEVEKAFEKKDSHVVTTEAEKLNFVIGNLFTLNEKKASNLMIDLRSIYMVSSNTTLSELYKHLNIDYNPFIPVFHKEKENIVAIVYPRDLLRAKKEERVIHFAKSPWFITKDTPILLILRQFRHNNQSVAVVIGENGKTLGILTLDQIIDNIFGEEFEETEEIISTSVPIYVEKTLPGDMLLSDFNKKFNANLAFEDAETINELMYKILQHHPSEGETIVMDHFEITVIEPSLLGAKTVSVKTVV